MDDQRLEEKLDKMADHMAEMNVTLGKQSIILEEHIRRTDLLEKKIEPIEKHVHRVEGAFKLIGLIATLAAIVEAMLMAMGRK